MQTINACPRGHRYRASVLNPGLQAPCSRCDRLALVALAYGDCQQPQRGCRSLGFKTEYITDFQEFCELLGVIGRYNAFHPMKVEDQKFTNTEGLKLRNSRNRQRIRRCELRRFRRIDSPQQPLTES